jgi:drug/metabolite transporter superfamily protein YnfA
MSRIAVYTAIAGGYDHLREQKPQDQSVDWIALLDDPMSVPQPWQYRPLPEHPAGPRMVAKVAKCFPRRFLDDYDYAIWVDGNMRITNSAFAAEAIASIRNGFATWAHPQRSCIYAEAEASLRLAPVKYTTQPINEQVAAYAAEGHPINGGLYAAGTIAWDLHDDRAMEVGAAWFAECERWSYQDQLSLPVACRRLGVTPGIFPYRQITGNAVYNPWLRIEPHLRED